MSAGLNFERVLHQVRHGAFEERAATVDDRRFAELDGDLATGAAAVPGHDALDEVAQLDLLDGLLAARVGGELHELGDEVGELPQLEVRLGQQLARAACRRTIGPGAGDRCSCATR